MSEEARSYTQHELERIVLQTLKEGGISTWIGGGHEGVIEKILEKHPLDDTWPKQRVAEAIWSLVARALVYIDFSTQPRSSSIHQHPSMRWSVLLTQWGHAAAEGKEYIPEDAHDYFSRFVGDVASAEDTVRRYVREALETYRQRCYLASAVMLGVASEATFLDMAKSFSAWLGPPDNGTLEGLLANRQAPFSALLREVHGQLQANVGRLADPLKDGLGIQVTAVADLIRYYRNDAGHPSGDQVSHETCHASLSVFPAAMRRMFELKEFFEA